MGPEWATQQTKSKFNYLLIRKLPNVNNFSSNWYQRKSSPIPTWNPFRVPSLLLATSGTPKLTSTLTGSSLYTKPTPADIEGFEIEATTVDCNDCAKN